MIETSGTDSAEHPHLFLMRTETNISNSKGLLQVMTNTINSVFERKHDHY
jgi:hypothetical protein